MKNFDNLVCDIVAIKNDSSKIRVFYDFEKENNYIIKSDVIITISDLKNMLGNTLVHLCNEVYDIEKIEYINEVMLENYINEINECIESDYYKEDMEILKELFENCVKGL